MKTAEVYGHAAHIQEITGAPVEILPILERIMRDEIFHSTLDWQTARQYNAAARKAHRIYQENRPFYDAENAWHAARWKSACADQDLRNAEQAGDPEAIQTAKAASVAAWVGHDEAYQNMCSLY